MAIEKNNFKLLSAEFSPHSKETIMSSDNEDFQRPSSAGVGLGDEDDVFDDHDSGVGSDDFDLLELGDAGEEFCQVGEQTCSIPYELYDLPDLQHILSLEVWNEVLNEEERFSLAQYIPDMDHEMFLRTLKELLSGSNLHFGNPVGKLYEMLKGGLCEPRVALYRQGLNFFQKRQHYHLLRNHHNSMVTSLCQMRDAWSSYKGYSIDEKLQVLNIMKSRKSLMYEKVEELESESSGRESGDVLWGKRIKDWKLEQRTGRHGINSSMDSRSKKTTLESAAKQTAKGLDSRRNKRAENSYGGTVRMKDQIMNNEEEGEELFPVSIKRYQNLLPVRPIYKAGSTNMGKKHESMIHERFTDSFPSTPWQNDMPAYGRKKPVNQLSDIEVLTANPSGGRIPHEYGRKVYIDQFQLGAEDQMLFGKGHSSKGYQMDPTAMNDPFFLGRAQGGSFTTEPPHQYGEWNMKRKKGKTSRKSDDYDRLFPIEYEAQPLLEKFKGSSAQNGEHGIDGIKGASPFSRNDETESDSSEQIEENGDANPFARNEWAYGSSVSDKKAGLDYKKAKFSKKVKQSNFSGYDGSSINSRKIDDYGEHLGMRKLGNYGMRVESNGEMHDVRFLNSLSGRNFDDVSLVGSGRLPGDDDWRQMSRLGRGGHMRGDYDVMPFKDSRGRSNISHEYIDPRSNTVPYSLEGQYHSHSGFSSRDNRVGMRMGKKGQVVGSLVDTQFERYDAQLIGCNTTKKRKMIPQYSYMDEQDGKEYHNSDKQLQVLDSDMSKRRGKRKLEIGNEIMDDEILENEISELLVNKMGVGDLEPDTKPLKKPFILITPTVHTGFSFSITHLLSAVRLAMITLLPEDSLNASSHLDKIDEKPVEKEGIDEKPVEKEGIDEKPVEKEGIDEKPVEKEGIDEKPVEKEGVDEKPVEKEGIDEKPVEKEGIDEKTMETEGKNLNAEGTSEVGALADENSSKPAPGALADESSSKPAPGTLADEGSSKPAPSASDNVPSLTVQEIVNRVKSNPLDPCILETQEPLQDLVRGVLKIFSSKTAPLGAKGWKPLALYEKTRKSWTWSSPVNQNPSYEIVEEVLSPEAWGLPHKMLVKLVDAFANWLKNGQETLQQIGSLPAPPLSLMQNTYDDKERFKDLRAQKSLSTINPSPEEVRSYFRKEEILRYSIPDRAFSYTAIDGKKSIVAPLRRCGGKPTSKARDHFMLKRDRPPHVTILCLVRDAAARLPGSIGTRADVCTLIRDSQYIVEDVSDAQVNQVVSGALDRLHYERDPCVQFDGDRKLWVYLHREREEEDFEDDGTSSTKKWKRQRKETTDQDQGVTVAYSGQREQPQLDLPSDPNVEIETQQMDEDKVSPQLLSHDGGKDHMHIEPEPIDEDKEVDIVSYDGKDLGDDNVENSHASEQGSLHIPTPLVCDLPSLNHIQESILLCQENSTNDDFDDEPSQRDPQ